MDRIVVDSTDKLITDQMEEHVAIAGLGNINIVAVLSLGASAWLFGLLRNKSSICQMTAHKLNAYENPDAFLW